MCWTEWFNKQYYKSFIQSLTHIFLTKVSARKGRNAHQAIQLAEKYYEEGYRTVVDCDLKSYFDTIHHQRLRAYLEEFLTDKIVLKLIWKFLRSGILDRKIFLLIQLRVHLKVVHYLLF